MNPSISLSRTCAQRCTRTTALRTQLLTQHTHHQPLSPSPSQPHHPSIRSITTTPAQFYAQPTIPAIQDDHTPSSRLATSLPSPSISPSTRPDQSPPPSKTDPSRLPSNQNQPSPQTLFLARITRTGSMPQTVQLTRNHQIYDPFLQKHYTRPLRLKAHDPNPPTYLREGDIVEYGVYTQEEKDARVAKDVERIRREEERLEKADKSGKAVRKFRRDEEAKKMLKGGKRRGVQFVVRRVVTPFGVGLDERMEALGERMVTGGEAVKAGQGSSVSSLGGSLSRLGGKMTATA